MKSSPQTKFGSSSKDDLSFKKQHEFKLPPDSYSPKDNFTKKAAASYGFGSGSRPKINGKMSEFVPAPGSYEIPSKI